PEPGRHGDAGEQTKPADFPIDRLPQQLELQRPLRAAPLRLELLALELQPTRIAIERFLQRGDDNAGETRLESAERRARARRRLEILTHVALSRARPPAPRQIGKADRGLEQTQPRYRHRYALTRTDRIAAKARRHEENQLIFVPSCLRGS